MEFALRANFESNPHQANYPSGPLALSGRTGCTFRTEYRHISTISLKTAKNNKGRGFRQKTRVFLEARSLTPG
jgi:hypothetical protein